MCYLTLCVCFLFSSSFLIQFPEERLWQVGEAWRERLTGLDNEDLRQLAEGIPAFMVTGRMTEAVKKYAHKAAEVWSREHKVIVDLANPFHIVLYFMHCTYRASSP